jgi:hypothetical protein
MRGLFAMLVLLVACAEAPSKSQVDWKVTEQHINLESGKTVHFFECKEPGKFKYDKTAGGRVSIQAYWCVHEEVALIEKVYFHLSSQEKDTVGKVMESSLKSSGDPWEERAIEVDLPKGMAMDDYGCEGWGTRTNGNSIPNGVSDGTDFGMYWVSYGESTDPERSLDKIWELVCVDTEYMLIKHFTIQEHP